MRILCIGSLPVEVTSCFRKQTHRIFFCPDAETGLELLEQDNATPQLVLFKLEQHSAHHFMRIRHTMLKEERWRTIPFVAISDLPSPWIRRLANRFPVTAHYTTHFAANQAAWCERLQPLLRQPDNATRPTVLRDLPTALPLTKKLPIWKRTIDLVGALVLILALSPVFLFAAFLIKLESRGPVLYISKRVGQNYKIFNFYKFRSMRTEADQLLEKIRKNNAYKHRAKNTVLVPGGHLRERRPLLRDEGFIDEQDFKQQKAIAKQGTFVKIQRDPRVTRFGWLIRKTSIDELPQLFNVLKGDMSLVGNRPLPLYEAEQLTQDEYIARFFGPAGITGLWQVTKRSQINLSPEERKKLDVRYALNYDLWMDLSILWKTLPAALQRDNA